MRILLLLLYLNKIHSGCVSSKPKEKSMHHIPKQNAEDKKENSIPETIIPQEQKIVTHEYFIVQYDEVKKLVILYINGAKELKLPLDQIKSFEIIKYIIQNINIDLKFYINNRSLKEDNKKDFFNQIKIIGIIEPIKIRKICSKNDFSELFNSGMIYSIDGKSLIRNMIFLNLNEYEQIDIFITNDFIESIQTKNPQLLICSRSENNLEYIFFNSDCHMLYELRFLLYAINKNVNIKFYRIEDFNLIIKKSDDENYSSNSICNKSDDNSYSDRISNSVYTKSSERSISEDYYCEIPDIQYSDHNFELLKSEYIEEVLKRKLVQFLISHINNSNNKFNQYFEDLYTTLHIKSEYQKMTNIFLTDKYKITKMEIDRYINKKYTNLKFKTNYIETLQKICENFEINILFIEMISRFMIIQNKNIEKNMITLFVNTVVQSMDFNLIDQIILFFN